MGSFCSAPVKGEFSEKSTSQTKVEKANYHEEVRSNDKKISPEIECEEKNNTINQKNYNKIEESKISENIQESKMQSTFEENNNKEKVNEILSPANTQSTTNTMRVSFGENFGPYSLNPEIVTRPVEGGYKLGPRSGSKDGNPVMGKSGPMKSGFRTVRVSSALNPHPVFEDKTVELTEKQREEAEFLQTVTVRDPIRKKEGNLAFRAVRNSIVRKGYIIPPDTTTIDRKLCEDGSLEEDIKRVQLIESLVGRNKELDDEVIGRGRTDSIEEENEN